MNPVLADWRGRRAWLVGASTGIGRATASALHRAGASVIVSARNQRALAAFAQEHRGAQALPLDAGDADAVQAAGDRLQRDGPLDLVLYCVGHYREQRATAFDLAQMLEHQRINYVGALHVLAAVLPAMVARGAGHVSLVASVAGYRGLPQSLAYGPTKAALINLAETLYQDLRRGGLGVSLINPGFVATPLTAGNDFHMPALMTPEQAAQDILRGWRRGAFEIHFPRRFTLPMKLVALLPFRVYQSVIGRATGL
jgi:short-subunit dehydrogenase